MSRILIIGSEGQLGSELSRFFNKKMTKDDIIISVANANQIKNDIELIIA